MKAIAIAVAFAAVPATIATIATPAISRADSCVASRDAGALPIEAPPCADVLTQEARWLTAITTGDVATIESILSPTYLHVNADGQMIDRAGEIAGTKPLPVTFHASDQIVDMFDGTAVIHGVNNIAKGGKVTDRQRFIDVFILLDGQWKALSAQETRI